MDKINQQTISVETRQAPRIKAIFKDQIKESQIFVKTLHNTKKMVDLVIKYPERYEETVKTLIRQTLTGEHEDHKYS